MYNHYLKLFITTADAGSFSKAAAKLFISPNAVIKQINNYEDHLGFALFQRSNRGIELTEEGKIIYSEGKKMIRRSDSILSEIRSTRAGSRGVVRIGSSFLYPAGSIFELWAIIRHKHPEISLRNVPFIDSTEHYFDPDDPVWESVDVVMAHFVTEEGTEGISRLKIEDHPVCIGMSSRHPLSKKGRLQVEDLNGESILIVSEGISCFIDRAREEMIKRCPDARLIDSPAYDIDTFNRCVENQYMMLSVLDWKDLHPSIVNVPVDWKHSIPTGLVWRTGSMSPAVKTFVQEIRSLMA